MMIFIIVQDKDIEFKKEIIKINHNNFYLSVILFYSNLNLRIKQNSKKLNY